MAASHCKEYVEVAKDGTKYEATGGCNKSGN